MLIRIVQLVNSPQVCISAITAIGFIRVLNLVPYFGSTGEKLVSLSYFCVSTQTFKALLCFMEWEVYAPVLESGYVLDHRAYSMVKGTSHMVQSFSAR